MKLVPTASQTAGPFVHLGLTLNGSIARVAGTHTQGEYVRLRCRITDGEGVAVPDAVIEIWQANHAGQYRHPDDPQTKLDDPEFPGFGRLAVGEDGSCTFETIKPGRVPGPETSLQAPHLNLAIFARGLLKQLVTRVYFENEPANAEDPILALVPAERRYTLLARQEPHSQDWHFEIRLSGKEETVFFDI